MLWPPWGKYLGNGIANDNYSINENVNDKAIVNGGDTDNGNDNVNGSNNGNDNDIDSHSDNFHDSDKDNDIDNVTVKDFIITISIFTIIQQCAKHHLRKLQVIMGHFRLHFSLYFKARLNAKSLLWTSVFIHIKIGTDHRKKNFAPRRAFWKRRNTESDYWFMVSVRLSSYRGTQGVDKHKRSVGATPVCHLFSLHSLFFLFFSFRQGRLKRLLIAVSN